jgi:hypothetical protein
MVLLKKGVPEEALRNDAAIAAGGDTSAPSARRNGLGFDRIEKVVGTVRRWG